MKITLEPAQIYKEYQNGVSYNTSLDLYDNVEKNENFYNDKQWEGVNAPDLDKPVFNFLKPVVNYYIAQIVSDDITTNVEVLRGGAGTADEIAKKALGSELESTFEETGAAFKHRQLLRNLAVDGDMCLYSYFDPAVDNGMVYRGAIRTEIVSNTDIYFGDVSCADVQQQPYLLLKQRRLTEDVIEEARAAQSPDWQQIVADDEGQGGESPTRYTTVLIKFWKEGGSVHYLKVTKDAVVKPPTDLEYLRYPLSYCSWEPVRNSYHGVSPLTGKRANQIFVNKLYAMSMEYTKKFVFPKVLIDRTKVPNWNNKVGDVVACNGDPREAMFASFQPAGLPADALNMITTTINQTKEMMGAYDAALGNIRPDNTSAIIAVQKAASMPLELQRMNFYQFVEDTVRVWIDIMAADYGLRLARITTAAGEEQDESFDFSQLREYRCKLKVEIGAAAYWSELMQVQTLDNLMNLGIIPDAVTYLENMPDGYIRGKGKIVQKIKDLQQQAAVAPAAGKPPAAALGGGANVMPKM